MKTENASGAAHAGTGVGGYGGGQWLYAMFMQMTLLMGFIRPHTNDSFDYFNHRILFPASSKLNTQQLPDY